MRHINKATIWPGILFRNRMVVLIEHDAFSIKTLVSQCFSNTSNATRQNNFVIYKQQFCWKSTIWWKKRTTKFTPTVTHTEAQIWLTGWNNCVAERSVLGYVILIKTVVLSQSTVNSKFIVILEIIAKQIVTLQIGEWLQSSHRKTSNSSRLNPNCFRQEIHINISRSSSPSSGSSLHPDWITWLDYHTSLTQTDQIALESRCRVVTYFT